MNHPLNAPPPGSAGNSRYRTGVRIGAVLYHFH